MKKIIHSLLLILLVMPMSMLSQVHAQHDVYTCPMHPAIVQDAPGSCPICGMDLVLQAEDNHTTGSSTIAIDPVVQQNMNLRVSTAVRTTLSEHFRTVGVVEAPHGSGYSFSVRFDGWIEVLLASEPGVFVHAGTPLVKIYSPSLITAQEEFLISLANQGKESAVAKAALQRLHNWNIPQSHIDELVTTGDAKRLVVMTSPVDGYVKHISVVPGDYVRAGTPLYHIVQYDSLWVVADVYDSQFQGITPGTVAQISVAGIDHPFTARVDLLLPSVDPLTRTRKMRFTLDNGRNLLVPGMYATLEIHSASIQDAVAVPTEAVLWTGSRSVVFIKRPDGDFESRDVVVGVEDVEQQLTQIVRGVHQGEIVVSSGQFLIDSESKLQEAVQKFLAASQDTTANQMQHDHRSPQKVYYTCPMHPTIVQDEPGTCPICGMDLIKKEE